MTALDFKLCRGILLRAPGAGDLVPNTDIIYIGRACVTADSNPGTGGMPLCRVRSWNCPWKTPRSFMPSP